jgi:hypothetical protein
MKEKDLIQDLLLLQGIVLDLDLDHVIVLTLDHDLHPDIQILFKKSIDLGIATNIIIIKVREGTGEDIEKNIVIIKKWVKIGL